MKVTSGVLGCGVVVVVVLGGCTEASTQTHAATPAATTSVASAVRSVSEPTTATPSARAQKQAGRAVPAGFTPVSVTFVSDHRGWVLGSAPCGRRACTTVLRTSDAGKSWHKISAPPASLDTASDAPGAVNQLRFADPRDGYADGVGLWETHDAGARWTRRRTVAGIPHAVVSDLTVSGTTVYALAAGTDPHYGGSDSHVRLVSATAGRGTFHVLADLGTKEQAADLVASHGAVYFLVSHIGGKGNGHLARVHDRSLTRTTLPAQSCENVSASTSTAVLLVCGDGVADGSMGRRVVYGSSDSGHSYHRLPSPGRGSGYDGSAVADAGDGHAVITTAGGASAALRSTSNGARSWHTSLAVEHGEFSELGFEDTTHGVVIASIDTAHRHTARLYRTTTAGAGWTHVVFR